MLTASHLRRTARSLARNAVKTAAHGLTATALLLAAQSTASAQGNPFMAADLSPASSSSGASFAMPGVLSSAQNSAYTMEAWVNLGAASSGIMQLGQTGAFQAGVFLQTSFSGGQHTLQFGGKNPGTNVQIVNGATFAPNTWTHVAATWTSGSTVTIYVNGSSSTGSWGGDGQFGYTTAGANTIGAINNAGTVLVADGSISGARVWEVVRTQAQLTANDAITNPLTSQSGLLLNYVVGSTGYGPLTQGLSGAGTNLSTSGNNVSNLVYTKYGSNNLTTQSGISYNSSLAIAEGTLTLGSANQMLDSGTLSINGGTLNMGGFSDTVGAVTLTSGSITNGTLTGSSYTADAGTISAILAGSGITLTKNTAGTLTLSGVNTYSGATTVNAGVLEIAGGSLASAITNDASVSFNSASSLSYGNVLSGSGTVSQDGSGTTTLSGNNSYAGATNVNAGKLQVTNANGLGTTAAGTSVASGATLEFGAGLTVAEDLTLNGGTLTTSGGTVNLTGALSLGSNSQISTATGGALNQELNLSGVVSGSGGFTFDGNSMTLSQTNSYDGNTSITGGSVFVSANGALGSTNGSTLVTDTGSAPTVGGLVFSGVNYTTTESVTLDGGYIAGAGTSSFAGPIAVSGSGVSAIAEGSHNGTLTLSGVISGSTGSLQFGQNNFSGTLKLTGTNTYSGPMSVLGGTLRIGDGGATGSIAPSGLTNNASVVYDRNDAVSVGYAIAGTGTLTQAGSGELTLSGTHTYTGNTTVSAGTLRIGDGVATGSITSNVIVDSLGTLAGSGSSTGSLSGAGMVAPGNSPGILTFASLDPSAGTDFNFEFTNFDPTYSNALASTNDLLHLTDGAPFTSALTSANVVNIYLNISSDKTYPVAGKTFQGGFFTDNSADFTAFVQNATFNYYLKAPGGSVSYNGVDYDLIFSGAGTDSVYTVRTVQVASANFETGVVSNGFVMQVVPEPSTFALLGMGVAGLAAAGYRRRKVAVAKTVA